MSNCMAGRLGGADWSRRFGTQVLLTASNVVTASPKAVSFSTLRRLSFIVSPPLPRKPILSLPEPGRAELAAHSRGGQVDSGRHGGWDEVCESARSNGDRGERETTRESAEGGSVSRRNRHRGQYAPALRPWRREYSNGGRRTRSC